MSLIDKIRTLVGGHQTLFVWEDGNELPRDVQIALAAILLEVVHGDAECSREEYKTLLGSLRGEIGLTGADAKTLMVEADEKRFSELAISPFIETARLNLDKNRRTEFLGMVWRLIHADSKVEEFEESFAGWLAESLELGEKEASRAKEMAAEASR